MSGPAEVGRPGPQWRKQWELGSSVCWLYVCGSGDGEHCPEGGRHQRVAEAVGCCDVHATCASQRGATTRECWNGNDVPVTNDVPEGVGGPKGGVPRLWSDARGPATWTATGICDGAGEGGTCAVLGRRPGTCGGIWTAEGGVCCD